MKRIILWFFYLWFLNIILMNNTGTMLLFCYSNTGPHHVSITIHRVKKMFSVTELLCYAINIFILKGLSTVTCRYTAINIFGRTWLTGLYDSTINPHQMNLTLLLTLLEELYFCKKYLRCKKISIYFKCIVLGF